MRRLVGTVQEVAMDLKLRKMFYSVPFWLSMFTAIVIFHSFWALTH
jgi:hypothetical protein